MSAPAYIPLDRSSILVDTVSVGREGTMRDGTAATTERPPAAIGMVPRLRARIAELEGQLRAMADQVAAHAELQQHAMLGWQAERQRRGELARELARTRRQIARLTWWQRLLARLVP